MLTGGHGKIHVTEDTGLGRPMVSITYGKLKEVAEGGSSGSSYRNPAAEAASIPRLAVCLKAYPDTNQDFFFTLLGIGPR